MNYVFHVFFLESFITKGIDTYLTKVNSEMGNTEVHRIIGPIVAEYTGIPCMKDNPVIIRLKKSRRFLMTNVITIRQEVLCQMCFFSVFFQKHNTTILVSHVCLVFCLCHSKKQSHIALLHYYTEQTFAWRNVAREEENTRIIKIIESRECDLKWIEEIFVIFPECIFYLK